MFLRISWITISDRIAKRINFKRDLRDLDDQRRRAEMLLPTQESISIESRPSCAAGRLTGSVARIVRPVGSARRAERAVGPLIGSGATS